MKNKILPILFFVSISICGMAQTAPPPPPPLPPPPPPPPPHVQSTTREVGRDTNVAFTFAEVMPTFIGEGGFNRYLQENVKYPTFEKEAGKQGTVYISFIIEKDGSITNVKERKGVPGAPGLTKEGIRVISGMPKWKPGTMNGHPVRIEMTQPIRFFLQDATPVSIKPSFPGGDSALANYIKQNLVYPAKEKKKHREGIVIVSFVVETDGSITHVKVMSDVSEVPGFGKEAKRLVSTMPDWTPGKFNGQTSRMTTEIRIEFKL